MTVRTDARPQLRVVQWASGNIGSRALRAVLEHPDLTLAGLYAHTPDKAGRDAGELCGLGPTGVIATHDIDEIVALGADCVLYMPRACDMDEVCRLLASGANVVTTRGEFHRAASLDPAVRERVEAACESGKSSIHSTGSSPGFITEALPLALSSIQRRLDGLTIEEFADLSQRDSPGLLFDVMGFGKPPAEYDERRLSVVRDSFGPSLRMVADTLSIPLDSVEAEGEVATAPRPVHIAAGTLRPNTVAAQRITVSGLRGGRPLLRFRATWYCTTDLDRAWDVRATGWHITVDGDAPLDIDLRFPVPLDRMAAMSPSYTANRAVNAVPVLCEASPGIRSTADLPHIVARLG
ncbi:MULTISPECIES: NAD(P)H-dependent amine dehydrogenase family protein [Streptomyces]|uniref:Dihydrodipicolinate reductase n=1 Tax=Streptomyces mirabilis TaxID=68239 RepID=A0ABU3V1K3_9ACTN|nr:MULTISPECIES: dihydrodipicolinate reductase [Streptomyces]MCX4614782.1 dihydrodipicolinate reductase [Streptomyces mirabilis]MCX5346547.1 dihydrodipicolinate reductase [Streptomyces mirabilis]MDU9000056.1 dihydrodipicolinate reductase [Streptomyces mirabilis]NMI55640.1 dihydrodipicolinate reductase [Streptomyces sp. RLA2-12]QDN55137.1 dihydrodipicolinate reductase [Streptomyces sp. S1D4-20]